MRHGRVPPRKPSLCRCVVAVWLCVVHYFDVAVSRCIVCHCSHSVGVSRLA